MQINRLDHANVVTNQLDVMVDWYTDILGLRNGDRPPFPFPGAWMYAGEHAVVHLVGNDEPPKVGSEVELKLEHFALSASGRAVFQARLEEAGERYELLELPTVNIIQYNIWDPDGNHIHIDFSLDE